VTLGGNWQIYTSTLPAGARAIGVVHRNGSAAGALAEIESTGAYVQVNGCVMRTLPQDKARAAVEAARAGRRGGPGMGQGRRAVDGATALQRRQVSLDQASIDTLADLGDGELSLGIRLAAGMVRAAGAGR